jgi:hypothetical protein
LPNRTGGAGIVGTVTGNDVCAATESTAGNGSQGYGGSFYTALNDTSGKNAFWRA